MNDGELGIHKCDECGESKRMKFRNAGGDYYFPQPCDECSLAKRMVEKKFVEAAQLRWRFERDRILKTIKKTTKKGGKIKNGKAN